MNLARFNEVYRVQMNKALKKYNPEIHLKELNKIQLNNIKVRRDMEKVKGKIKKTIMWYKEKIKKLELKNNNKK